MPIETIARYNKEMLGRRDNGAYFLVKPNDNYAIEIKGLTPREAQDWLLNHGFFDESAIYFGLGTARG